MGAYEDMICVIRRQGAAKRDNGIQLAYMTGKDSLKIGDLLLTSEDLKFDESLIYPKEGNQALKAGDEVAVVRVSENLYLVLGRMVRA